MVQRSGKASGPGKVAVPPEPIRVSTRTKGVKQKLALQAPEAKPNPLIDPTRVAKPLELVKPAAGALPKKAASRTGNEAIVEQLKASGLSFVIGNPGSTEDLLFAALGNRVKLGYAEGAAVGIADGYAQAAGKPAVVVLHGGVGLGSGAANIIHARQRHTPMLIIVGEAGSQYQGMQAHMYADLVTMARGLGVKLVKQANNPKTLLQDLREAITTASSPPYGPVVFIAPRDVLAKPNAGKVAATPKPSVAGIPETAAIEQAADVLRGAKRPIILMGDDVARSGAQAELVKLAETLGAPVYGAMESEVNMPRSHPLYAGQTGHMFGKVSRDIVKDADAVLVVGTYIFPEVFPSTKSPFRPSTKIISINETLGDILKGGHNITHPIVAGPKPALGMLAAKLGERATAPEKRAAETRSQNLAAKKSESVLAARAQDEAAPGVTVAKLAKELERQMAALEAQGGERPVIFDEAITGHPQLARWIKNADTPGLYFQTPGGTLGVGVPGAIGTTEATGKRSIAFVGDGGVLYTEQALATAARYNQKVGVVVIDNAAYGLLDVNLDAQVRMAGGDPKNVPRPSVFDLSEPKLDFVKLAAGHGVKQAVRVESEAEIAPAVSAMLKSDGPFLIHLVVARPAP